MTSSGQSSAASALGNITNVIVLMFENRSFDHLLGAMPGVDGVLDASGCMLVSGPSALRPITPCLERQ